VNQDLKQLAKITKKIAKATEKVDVQQQWIDQAEKTMATLERRMKKVNETRDDLVVELDILRRKKLEVRRQMAESQLSRDLRDAHKSLIKVVVKDAELGQRKEELSDAEEKLATRVSTLQQKLMEATKWIKTIKKLPPVK